MRRSRATPATTIPDDGTVDLSGLEVDDFFFDGETEAELAASPKSAPEVRPELAAQAPAPVPVPAPAVAIEPVAAAPAAEIPVPAPAAARSPVEVVEAAPNAELEDDRSWGVTDFFADELGEPASQGPAPEPDSGGRVAAPPLYDELPESGESEQSAVAVRRPAPRAAEVLAELAHDVVAPAPAPAPRARRQPRVACRRSAVDRFSPRLSLAIAAAGVALAVAAVSGVMPGAGQSPAIAGPSAAPTAEGRESAVSGALSLRPVGEPIRRSVRKAARAAQARREAAERRAKARARRAAAERRARRASQRRVAASRRAAPVGRAAAAPAVAAAPRAYSPPAAPAARPSVPRNRPAAKSPAGKEFGW